MIKLSAANFVWSLNEQVYPFGLSDTGAPLYCKQVDMGGLPNAGIKNVALGLGADINERVFSDEAWATTEVGNYMRLSNPNFGTYDVNFQIYQGNARIQTNQNFAAWNSSFVRVIYWK